MLVLSWKAVLHLNDLLVDNWNYESRVYALVMKCALNVTQSAQHLSWKEGYAESLKLYHSKSASCRTRCWLLLPQPCWTLTCIRKRQQIATLMMSLCRHCFCWHIWDCLMLVILFSLWSLLFLGTHHNLFSYSAMLTTEVDKIKHPKSHNPEMPGDFSCYLSSEWPPAPQNVPTSSSATHFFPPSHDILWDCPHRNLKLLMLPLSGFQTFNPFY